MANKKPLVLTILDGWGYAPASKSNAISLARKPNYDRLRREFPNTLVETSGRAVGLPAGQMGNSEVGHLNIGAGRVVYMDQTKVDVLLESGDFFRDPALLGAMEHGKPGGRKLHILGLLSDGGVHSNDTHLFALLRMAKQNGVERTYVHAFMDGRDTLPTNGAGYVEKLQQKMREYGVGKIASVSGRYYAMDRDRRWAREKLASDAMVHGKSEQTFSDTVEGVKQSYNNGVSDEFIVPFVVTGDDGGPVATIGDEDACICFNFRADRVRQITRVLARNSGLTKQGGRELEDAEALDAEVPRSSMPRQLHYVCMTQYDQRFTLPVVVPPQSMRNILANVMADAGVRNLRVVETEKYAHVTYFFNGGVEQAFSGEERILVPSQKVATYDLAPEMSAQGIADTVVKAVKDTAFEVIIVNFANADMVGHSGKIGPTVQGVETIDRCLGEVYEAVRRAGGSMIITADHGNAEQMIDKASGGPQTAHTTNPVPLILVGEEAGLYTLRHDGSLQDVSPTALGMLRLQQPGEMSGSDLRVLR
ncbi:MAG: 2,3-bisphosphoglycerate-independent phosphoglycerate mutase [Acidobacteriaceae bacterium]